MYSSKKDLDTLVMKQITRSKTLLDLHERRITEKEASQRIGVGVRQVRRLLRAFRANNLSLPLDGRLNNPGRPQLPSELKEEVKILASCRYAGFKPTFMEEKLLEEYGIDVSRETLRKWLTGWGQYVPRKQRTNRIHELRYARSCYGELVQIDGSHHNWFGSDRERCCLLVAIDDATSKLVGLHFSRSESTDSYFGLMRNYLNEHGIPQSLYCDRHSVFKDNTHGGETQFSRAAKTLSIEIIHASTPEAKGRVERVNRTLQDRLVKELKLRGIVDIEAANTYVPEYIKKHNDKFSKEPACPENKHSSLTLEQRLLLPRILSRKYHKRLSKADVISHKGYYYQIHNATLTARRRGVTLYQHEEETFIISATKKLDFDVFKKPNTDRNKLLNRKQLNYYLDRKAWSKDSNNDLTR